MFENTMFTIPARNQFERFRGFLELISRFEFEFCRRENFFLKDSNFWCVHVNVPWPVCAHAFPFRMLWLPRSEDESADNGDEHGEGESGPAIQSARSHDSRRTVNALPRSFAS